MDNKNHESAEKEKVDKEKMRNMFQQMADSKEKVVAKDLVELKHVEVQKQKVNPEAAELANRLKAQVLEHDKFEELSNDELTMLECFQNRRLFLTRIAIIMNQSRIPLGIEPLKKQELEDTLDSLSKKGYLISEKVGDKMVFFLSERGKYRVQ